MHTPAGVSVATLALALTGACFLAGGAAAEPRQRAAMVPDPSSDADQSSRGASSQSDQQDQLASARTPRKPDTPADPSMFVPPLPGYALMFILGGAIVALNLWSSKRSQTD